MVVFLVATAPGVPTMSTANYQCPALCWQRWEAPRSLLPCTRKNPPVGFGVNQWILVLSAWGLWTEAVKTTHLPWVRAEQSSGLCWLLTGAPAAIEVQIQYVQAEFLIFLIYRYYYFFHRTLFCINFAYKKYQT